MSSEISAVYVSNDEHNDDCLKFTNKIKSAFYNIAREFVYIGFLLAECDYYETYKEWGYSSIHEYASDRLGLKKSSTYNFINVCKAFTEPTECMPCSYFMKDKYESFNYSQLVEMLSMSDKQRSQVTPDMTVKQIREVKKNDIDFEHYFYCNLKHEEFEFSMSKKVEGKKYVLTVAGVLVEPSDVHPEGYYISFDGWLASDSGFGSFSKPFTVIDNFVDCIYDYFNRYDKSDDSRRLECESSEGENDSNSLVKTYLGSRKVNEQNVFNFFDELEDLYLSFDDSDKSLFDCAQQLFEKYSFYLNQDIYVYK